MQKYREMLKQALRGSATCNAIANSRGMSHHTVRRWRDIATARSLTVADVNAMSDSELNLIFYPRRNRSEKVAPDWDQVEAHLAKNYNLFECHMKYVEQADGRDVLAYSTFCQHFQIHQAKKVVVLRQRHVGGYAMQIDFAGYMPEGLDGGIRRKFQLFVAVLPASHYIFAVVVRSQSASDHVEANIAALEFYGGAPLVVTPDNLKAAVIKNVPRGTPVINPKMLAMADYYGMRVEPARPRTPQDKASVEVAVKYVQRVLSIALRDVPLMELADINRYLREIVSVINNRKMKRGNESRRERFERLDKPALQPLPLERLEFLDVPVERRVQNDHHVAFENVHYSVPYRLTGALVSIRGSARAVEIRHDGQIVAVHPRCHVQGEFVTNDLHRPDNHRSWLGIDFDQWRIGLCRDIGDLVDLCLAHTPNLKRERGRVMERVRRLEKLYGEARLIAAIGIARRCDAMSFKHVENMLRNNVDQEPDQMLHAGSPIKTTSNVRGSGYFARDLHYAEPEKGKCPEDEGIFRSIAEIDGEAA